MKPDLIWACVSTSVRWEAERGFPQLSVRAHLSRPHSCHISVDFTRAHWALVQPAGRGTCRKWYSLREGADHHEWPGWTIPPAQHALQSWQQIPRDIWDVCFKYVLFTWNSSVTRHPVSGLGSLLSKPVLCCRGRGLEGRRSHFSMAAIPLTWLGVVSLLNHSLPICCLGPQGWD